MTRAFSARSYRSREASLSGGWTVEAEGFVRDSSPGRDHFGLNGNLADMLPNDPVTRACRSVAEKLELRTVWMDVVRTVRSAMRGGESRRRVPYGMRSDEQPLLPVETEEMRATRRRVLVAFEEGADRGRMARYFRSLGWTVDVKEGSDDGVRHHDLAIVGIPAERHDVAAGFDRLQDIRRRDPGAVVIVLGDLSPAMEAEAKACGAQAVVQAPHYLPDLGHLAFSLTGVFHG